MIASQNTVPISASDILFAEVELEPKAWEDHLRAQRALNIRTWKEPTTFEWQLDGYTYQVEPGKKAIVPMKAAQKGVASSYIFSFMRDQYGKDTVELDHNLGQHPMLQIVRSLAGSDPGLGNSAIQELPPSADPMCPYCAGEVQISASKFKEHLESEHGLVPRSTGPPPSSEAEKVMQEAQRA